MSRTEWYVVNAQIELRNRETVRYAQDDIKTETRPGTKVHPFIFVFQVDEYSKEEHLNGVADLYLKNVFRYSPKLDEGRPSSFEVKEIAFTKAQGVFQAFEQ